MSYDEKLLREFIRGSMSNSDRVDELLTTAAGSEEGYGDITQKTYTQRWGGPRATGILGFLGLPKSVETLLNSLFKCWIPGGGFGIENIGSTKAGFVDAAVQARKKSGNWSPLPFPVTGSVIKNSTDCGLFPSIFNTATAIGKTLLSLIFGAARPGGTGPMYNTTKWLAETLFPFSSRFFNKWFPKSSQTPGVGIFGLTPEGVRALNEQTDVAEVEDLLIDAVKKDLEGIDEIVSLLESVGDIMDIIDTWSDVVGGDTSEMSSIEELLSLSNDELSTATGIDFKALLADDMLDSIIKPSLYIILEGAKDSLLSLNFLDDTKSELSDMFSSSLEKLA